MRLDLDSSNEKTDLSLQVREMTRSDASKNMPQFAIGEGERGITRVVLAEDHDQVRSGIRHMLERNQDITVIGEASNGIQAIDMVEELKPDVLILDMEMPLLGGAEVADYLRNRNSKVRILVLSAHDDQQYIRGMLKRGAAGYLVKEEVPETLVNAVRGVAHGERVWVSKSIAERMKRWERKDSNPSNELWLTGREKQVLRLLSNGSSVNDIAREMDISHTLVQRHIDTLCTKLGVTEREQLLETAKRKNYL